RLLNQLHQEAARHWFRAHSEHFILLAPPHAPVARHAEDFLRRREASLRTLVERLGQTPDGPITIYVYNSSRQAWKLLGRPIGFADPARREIHVRADQEPGHEETHIIAWTWNHRGCGVPFLEEGLAVSLSTHPGSPGAGAAAVLARGVMPDLADLVTRFHDFRYGYVLAGSFVSNLLEHNGMEAVRKLYSGRPDEFIPGLEQETGKKLAWLQAAWETELAAQGTASREPIIMALSLLRLDHLDEALNLLEEQHSVEPDNPAVEFALAHALKENGDLEAASGVYRRMLRLHLPYHLAWMKKRARQALLELEARPFPGSETESQP
ncbi:MAG: tetratricopeptide repeat protein, partial [Acidobacteriota bacterium]